MQKLRYELDPHNRLVISSAGGQGRKTRLNYFRRVLDGRFKLGPGNVLTYHIKDPAGVKLPRGGAIHQVKLVGKWSLDKNHDLKFTLNNWKRQTYGDELTFQGELLGVETRQLLFAVTTRSAGKTTSIYVLKLRGRWQADKQNRLTFQVKQGAGVTDTLTLDGIWEVDKKNKLIYRYRKTGAEGKEKKERTLEFKGVWDVFRQGRLTYKLSRSAWSGFNFQVSGGRVTKNYLRFEVGIKAGKRRRPLRRVVTLFGVWKPGKPRRLIFSLDYGQGKVETITFGASGKFTRQDTLELKLKSKAGAELGLQLKLTRKLLKGGGEAFLKLFKNEQSSGVYLGRAISW